MNKRKAVLVTGTSSGNGRAIALELKREGYKVFTTVRNRDDLEEMKSLSLTPLILDIRYPEQIEEAYEFVKSKLEDNEELFAIVNNAGLIVMSSFELMPEEEVRLLIDTNITGHIFMIQKFIPLLKESKGKIINISSVAGRVSFPLMGLYSATKAAINSISDALRIELAKWHIDVITIEPGAVKTPGWGKAKKITDKIFDKYRERILKDYKTEFKIIYKALEHQEIMETSTQKVAKQVAHALRTKTPRVTFRVGFGARWLNFISKFIPLNHLFSIALKLKAVFK